MGKEKSKKTMKCGYRVHPMAVKIQAVDEYEKGLYSAQVICERLSISVPAFHNWRQQIRKYGDGMVTRSRCPEELKLRIVKGIVMKMLSVQQASEQYKVSQAAIKNWCSKYSCQLAKVNEDAVPKEQENNPVDQDRIRQLERALEDANLKIIGLETMINVAEQDLKIDIRKKSGTKQSKS